jgi:hypothetical protein
MYKQTSLVHHTYFTQEINVLKIRWYSLLFGQCHLDLAS